MGSGVEASSLDILPARGRGSELQILLAWPLSLAEPVEAQITDEDGLEDGDPGNVTRRRVKRWPPLSLPPEGLGLAW